MYRGQAIVEFAIALPILLILMVGILEVGRAIFIYSAVTNASREAVRYASAVGLDDSGNNKYQYCDGIRNTARKSAYFLALADGDIVIEYDDGPGTSVSDTCDGTVDNLITADPGDRVRVIVTAQYDPMLDLIPISSQTITSSSSRTIFGIVGLEP
jgi:Flp pilus assembly protein TadG